MALTATEVAKIAHLDFLLADIESSWPLDAIQPLREDKVTETSHREQYQAIAPATDAGCYLVPKVIE